MDLSFAAFGPVVGPSQVVCGPTERAMSAFVRASTASECAALTSAPAATTAPSPPNRYLRSAVISFPPITFFVHSQLLGATSAPVRQVQRLRRRAANPASPPA